MTKLNTNVPAVKFTATGLVLPTEKEILDGVIADINAAFGGGLNTQNLETPQGQLASSIAAIIADKNNQINWLINNLDPDYSDGILQDAIGKIYFIKRKGQINSIATVTFTGLSGTFISQGYAVIDKAGNEWVTDNDCSIGINGTVDTTVTARGIYPAEANTITEIKQAIVGLDTVNNKNPAINGIAKESRDDFAARYKKSVAKNSIGMPASVYANVANLAGVTDCYVIDNPKDSEITVGSSSFKVKPHSIYVAVVGGDDNEIAKTIWIYSGNGCDFNGNKTITVTDDAFTDPKPSYEISFMRPQNIPLHIKVSFKRGGSELLVENAKANIIEKFNALSGNKIGATIYSADFITHLTEKLSGEKVLSLTLSIDGKEYKPTVTAGIDQIFTVSNDRINVTVE